MTGIIGARKRMFREARDAQTPHQPRVQAARQVRKKKEKKLWDQACGVLDLGSAYRAANWWSSTPSRDMLTALGLYT